MVEALGYGPHSVPPFYPFQPWGGSENLPSLPTFSIPLAHCLSPKIPSQSLCAPLALLAPHALEDPCRSSGHQSPAQLGTEGCLGRKRQGGGDTGPEGWGNCAVCLCVCWGLGAPLLCFCGQLFHREGLRLKGDRSVWVEGRALMAQDLKLPPTVFVAFISTICHLSVEFGGTETWLPP